MTGATHFIEQYAERDNPNNYRFSMGHIEIFLLNKILTNTRNIDTLKTVAVFKIKWKNK